MTERVASWLDLVASRHLRFWLVLTDDRLAAEPDATRAALTRLRNRARFACYLDRRDLARQLDTPAGECRAGD